MARSKQDQIIVDAMNKLVKVGAKIEETNVVTATSSQGKAAGLDLKALWQSHWGTGDKAGIDQFSPSRPKYRLIYQSRRSVLK